MAKSILKTILRASQQAQRQAERNQKAHEKALQKELKLYITEGNKRAKQLVQDKKQINKDFLQAGIDALAIREKRRQILVQSIIKTIYQ